MVKKPRLFIALCTLPALILTIVFMIVPMVNAIYLSFTSSTALSVGFNSKFVSVSYTHLRAHETSLHLVCRLLLEKKK